MIQHPRGARRAARPSLHRGFVEPLESRQLLSAGFVPDGNDFLVDHPGGDIRFMARAVAADAEGNYVVAWYGKLTATDENPAALARRFAADGTPLGSTFRVSTAPGGQFLPTVAMNRAGDFAFAWENNIEGSGQTDIYARIFDHTGVPKGDEFRVNVAGERAQMNPDVGIDDAGRVVVTWADDNQFVDADRGWALNYRMFDASGAPLTGDTLVGGVWPGLDAPEAVAVEPDGDFVIAWSSLAGNVLHRNVVAQRFDRTGAPRGPRIEVAPEAESSHLEKPDVATNAGGQFVVTWAEGPGRGKDGEIYARPFDANGAPLQGPIHVNTRTAGTQEDPSVTIDDTGAFLVAWGTNDLTVDGDRGAIAARGFDAGGVPQGDEFTVNTTTAGGQLAPHVAGTGGGDAVVVWMSDDGVQPVAVEDLYARRFHRGEIVPTPAVVGRGVFYDGPGDDNDTMAADKQALLPGHAASFANVTSSSRGLNGVVVDVANLPQSANDLSAADFVLKSGNTNDPSTWAAAPAPSGVEVDRGAGAAGSDRITLTWGDNAVKNAWLQVTLPAGGKTGLARPDVFYFGNLVGETGNESGIFRVNALDLAAVRSKQLSRNADDVARYDFNHDGQINAVDLSLARGAQLHSIQPLVVPPTTTPSALAATKTGQEKDELFA